jgi:hypothetical protein
VGRRIFDTYSVTCETLRAGIVDVASTGRPEVFPKSTAKYPGSADAIGRTGDRRGIRLPPESIPISFGLAIPLVTEVL